jgi:hypothetical protein
MAISSDLRLNDIISAPSTGTRFSNSKHLCNQLTIFYPSNLGPIFNVLGHHLSNEQLDCSSEQQLLSE